MKAKILLADDDEEVLAALSESAKKSGVGISQAEVSQCLGALGRKPALLVQRPFPQEE